MKHLTVAIVAVILALMLATLATPAYAIDLDLTYSAGFVPPHNEPVVGNKVARYRTQVGLDLEQGWLHLAPELTFWHVNTWVPPDQQLSNRWRDDDWSIEETRPTMLLNIDIGPKDSPKLFSEYFAPLGNWSHSGSRNFSSYWWIVGVRGELNLLGD